MNSGKRLQRIYRILEEYYPELIVPEASTLLMNYFEFNDFHNIKLPNINCYTTIKKQRINAKRLGLKIPSINRKKHDIVISSIPKSREEALGQLAIAYQIAKFGGLIIVEGNKRSGIDSVIRELSKTIKIEHLEAKAHGKIAIIKVSSKNINPFLEWRKYTLPSKNYDGFFTVPGLFSYKRIDAASKFLTTVFNNQLSGDIIDLGSGWGFLSWKLLETCDYVKSITLLDHDQRALSCAKMNLLSNKVQFKWLDIEEIETLDFKFDNAVCNPPFHSNTEKNIQLGRRFIKAAHGNLKSNGRLLLVANIQLPYEKIVKTLFHDFEIHSQNKNFKIILAKRPKTYYDTALLKI